MKAPALAALILMVLLLVPYGKVPGASQLEYTIQIRTDGSATWTVTQTLGVNSSIETVETLQNRITLLAAASENTTGRTMTASVDSLAFTRSANSSYVEAQYKFDWENFSEVEGSRILIGDVFGTPNFFDRLYGDGQVYVIYPSQYVVDTVKPTPFSQNDSIQTLEWLGTTDLENDTRIVLIQESATPSNFIDTLRGNVVLIVGLVAIAAGSSAVLFSFRRNRKRKISTLERGEPRNLPIMENDEERTVKLIRSSGGTVYQSAITDQFRFSKSKTSQLLAVLEHKGIIRRYKKGRDKVVVLVEENKGEIS
jgi:uncharacterized membrane protein